MAEVQTKTKKQQVYIQFADMPEEMQEKAIKYAEDSLKKFNLEQEMAAYIKKQFDKKYENSWHVVVGKNYSSFVSAEENNLAYFQIGQFNFLIFKA